MNNLFSIFSILDFLTQGYLRVVGVVILGSIFLVLISRTNKKQDKTK